MQIIHLVSQLAPGGIELWLLRLLQHWPSEIPTTIVAGRADSDFLERIACLPSVRAVVTAGGSPWSIGKWTTALGVALKNAQAAGGPTILHSHLEALTAPVVSAARPKMRSLSSRIVIHSHNTGYKEGRVPHRLRGTYHRWLRSWLSRQPGARVACSRAAARFLFKDDRNCVILPYGLVLDEFASRKGSPPRGNPELVCVGSLTDQKNQAFLLEVLAVLRRDGQPHKLRIAGTGPNVEAIKKRATELGVLDLVVWHGAEMDVPGLLTGERRIFAMPSLFEGLGIAALEAQAAGLPCLVSDALPPEAIVIPRLVQRLPLSEGPSPWAKAVVQTRLNEFAGITTRVIRDAFTAQGRTIETNAKDLIRLYEAQIQDMKLAR